MAQEGANCMVQGRIVWTAGDLFKGRQKTDQTTKQLRVNAKGEPMMEYGFGLAVPKTSLANMAPGAPGEVWRIMHEQAKALYPTAPQIPPNFAMKYKDGDTDIDDKGVPYSQREGYPGCIVLACTTTIPIKYYKWEGGQNVVVPEGIKCGDYVNVQLNVVAHPASGNYKPGLYLNPNAVQLVRVGEAIVNAPNGDQIFGASAPPGMDYAPQMGAMPMPVPTGMPGFPPAQPQGFAAPPSQGPMNLPPVAAPAPHYGVMPAVHQQPAQPQAQWGQQPQGFAPPPQPQGMPVQSHNPFVNAAPPQVPNGYPAAPPAGAPQFGGFPPAAPGGAPTTTPFNQQPAAPGYPFPQFPGGQQ